MSKSTSPRATTRIDWQSLLNAVEDESGVTPEAHELWMRHRWSDPRPSWGRDYLHALQQAIEQRSADQLLTMLDAAIPLPEVLLPALAEVVRDLRSGYVTGRSSKLTALDDQAIRRAFNRLQKHDKDFRVGQAHTYLAEIKNVSTDTIKRSLKRTQPASR